VSHHNHKTHLACAVRAAINQARPATFAVCSLLVANPVLISAAYAQAEGSPGILEEVIVSARKRDERLTDVPVSISAATAEAIDSANVQTLTELFALMPGVENNSDGSRIADKPAIRGVGSQENAWIRAKVTSFIDGVPWLGAQGIGSFAGLERVEVLRGPQSAAFGRSTFGGAINYVTRNPGDELEVNLRAGFGSDEYRNLSGVVSTPLGDKGFGVVVTAEERNYGGSDDWVTTSGVQLGEQNSKVGSIKLAYDSGDVLSGSFMYVRQEIDDSEGPIQFADLSQYQAHPQDPDGRCAINGGMNSCAIIGRVNNDLVPLVFEYDYDNPSNPVLDPGTRITRDRFQGALNFDFESGYSLSLIAAHTEEVGDTWFDRDGFTLMGMSTIHAASTPESEEKYGEIRLSSPSENRFNWLVGASIYDFDYFNTVYNNKTADIIMGFFQESARNVGAFFNVGYDLTENLTASFEGRFQSDEISGEYPADAQRGAPEPIGVTETTKSFQPRVSLTYSLNDTNNVYLQASRGTNPAGFNVVLLDPILQQTSSSEGFDLDAFIAFDEEEIRNYEIGLKGATLDNKLRYSIAAYYLDWKGYVQPVTLNWTPDDGVLLPGTGSNDYFQRTFIGIGDLDGFGFELEGTWLPASNLIIGAVLSYSGLEYSDNACSPVPLDYGVPADQTSPFACASVEGNRTPMFSPFTTALNVTYEFDVGASLTGYTRLDHQYRSKRYVESTNTDYIEAFHMVNLRAGLRSASWSAELFVENALDDDTPGGAVRFFDGRQPGMVFGSTFQLRRPRTMGIRLAYDL
jgi:iron complex outermembrane receptor protein